MSIHTPQRPALKRDLAIPPISKPIHVPLGTPEHLQIKGTTSTVRKFKSSHLDNFHDIDVYLPPGYDASESMRYPVLYTIGWNTLFITGSAESLPEGTIDEANESIVSLLREGAIKPFIMVSVSPDLDPHVSLMDECAPTRLARTRVVNGVQTETMVGGNVHLFAKFLTEEIKPWVDTNYRTLQDPHFTGITGISKWGMGTFYIAMHYPTVFGMVGGMSPAVSWDNFVLERMLADLPHSLPLRVWMGSGEHEEQYMAYMDRFEKAFKANGIREKDLDVLVVKGGDHSGSTWGPSVGPMLRFMFAP